MVKSVMNGKGFRKELGESRLFPANVPQVLNCLPIGQWTSEERECDVGLSNIRHGNYSTSCWQLAGTSSMCNDP